MMYEELVKLARHCSEIDACINCPVSGCEGTTGIMNHLADAIEELSKKVEGSEAAQEISPEAQYFVDTKADSIIDGLQSLLASVEERPHWIPVTEQLPSPMRAVLVYAPYKHNIFMAYLQGEKWYVWGPDDISCHNWPEYHAITHWMNLPQDPEPAKEEHDG